MKKVGIVSCYFIRNYGSVLQAYALQKFLDERNIENETICTAGFMPEINAFRARYFLSHVTDFALLKSRLPYIQKKILSRFGYRGLREKLGQREEAIERFANTIRLSESMTSLADLRNKSKEYDIILLGSDQLWHPSNIAGRYYTLEWVADRVKTATYATSFGVSVLDKKIAAAAADFLKKIQHISVREVSGQKLVNDLTGQAAKVVCDPALLFSRSMWDTILPGHNEKRDKYIFCYFLGTSKAHRTTVEKLKERTGFKIVALPHIDAYVGADEHYADELLYDVSPGEFIHLICNAELICTDSFHATIFSVLYEKDFWTFQRFTGGAMSTNSRIESLAQALGLQSRIVRNPEILMGENHEIDYCRVYSKLKKIRKDSEHYLEDIFSIQ